MQLYAADQHREMPWANGQGTTWEVAVAGDGDFDWRLSFAAVEGTTTFSAFPGVDRVIVLVEGERLHLEVDGRAQQLLPYEPFAFAGEAAVTCVAPAPTTDFNVMTRRGRYDATVECFVLAGESMALPEHEAVVFVVGLTGSLVAAGDRDTEGLAPRDVVRGAREVSGDGTVAVVVLSVR